VIKKRRRNSNAGVVWGCNDSTLHGIKTQWSI
jgi:hypothetical protein